MTKRTETFELVCSTNFELTDEEWAAEILAAEQRANSHPSRVRCHFNEVSR